MERDRSDGPSPFESLAARLDRIESRLDALERGTLAAPRPEPLPQRPTSPPPVGLVPPSPGSPAASTPPLFAVPASSRPETALPAPELPHTALGGALAPAGRSLLVLAGAFVLRSLTESGAWPLALGVTLGIAYGLLWLVFADRAAGKGATVGASFHGLTSAVIVFPLLFEATITFHLLPAQASALALLAAGFAGSAVARRRGLASLIWIEALGAAATALALAVASRELLLFAGVLLGIALIAFWAGSLRRWSGPGWVVVALLDGLVALIASVALIAAPERTAPLFGLPALVSVLLALVTLSFAAFMARTYRTRGPVLWQEIAQGTFALVLGFGGALAVTYRAGAGVLVVGAVGLALAGAAYLAGFTFIDRIEGRRASFIFYTTAALALTLLGAISIVHGAFLAIALSVVALATMALGSARRRETLSLHATVLLIAAAAGAGLGRLVIAALFRSQGPPATTSAPALLVVLVAAAVFCWLPVASHGRTWGSISRWAKLIVWVVLCLGVYEVAVAASLELARGAGHELSLPALAVLRTALLSVSAILLALIGRSDRLRDASMLVYPVLVLGALKLIFEDLRVAQPAALVLSFALFGGALIVAPRLARRAASRPASRT